MHTTEKPIGGIGCGKESRVQREKRRVIESEQVEVGGENGLERWRRGVSMGREEDDGE